MAVPNPPASTTTTISITLAYRGMNPNRDCIGTPARWLSVSYTEKTTPLAANRRPTSPMTNGQPEDGIAATASSTVC